MIYKQHHMPQHAVIGSAWLCPNDSFKRVLSRGGAWENVSPGTTHPDERDHDDEQQQNERTETEQRVDSTEVPAGAGESAPGDGDDGQVSGGGHVGEGAEDTSVITETRIVEEIGDGTITLRKPEEPGVDANGSPVL